MNITVDKQPADLTMTVTVELDATVERAWQLWADPRQLERWWGPPGYPATFTDHDLTPGSTVRYYMTSPEGEKYHGLWTVLAVDAPNLLEVADSFADDTGARNDDMPTGKMTVTFAERAGGATMVVRSYFESLEDMERLIEMGQEEGMVAAMGQIEAILAEAA